MRSLEIPAEWEQLELSSLRGVLLVAGAPDVGKTTFAKYLFQRLRGEIGEKVALLDGDPGQSWLGPPATMTLATETGDDLPAERRQFMQRVFIGSVSPRGHMLQMLVGAARLVSAANAAGMQAVVYDTSGLIDPNHGGLALKIAKTDLLRPSIIFAIQREAELQPLLTPLRRSRRVEVVAFRPSAGVRRRDINERRSHRARQFSHYFADARSVVFDWTKLAVFPLPRFRHHRLVALEDRDGFLICLGIVTGIDRPGRRVALLAPQASLDQVNAIRLGDLLLDPETFQGELLG